jgi:hypothetical protein
MVGDGSTTVVILGGDDKWVMLELGSGLLDMVSGQGRVIGWVVVTWYEVVAIVGV